ncbi:hypothetical protein Tco_0481526 [Tanacetum coccineum]
MESEFIALDKCGEEAEWLRQFVEDIPRWPKPVTAISIHCDSKSAMGRAKSTMYNGKSRHIRRRHNSIRQLLSTGVISIDYVASKDNIADPFTKGLSRELVSKYVRSGCTTALNVVPWETDSESVLREAYILPSATEGEFRMMGPTSHPVTPLNRITEYNDNQNNSLSLQDQILSHISSLETLIKQHNERAGILITPIRLTFTEVEESNKGKDNKCLGEENDEDLKRPYKEVLKSPFTRRIIKFSAPNHRMATNLKPIKDNGRCRFGAGCFSRLWTNQPEGGSTACLTVAKTIGQTFEKGVPEVMQISAFMSNSKCPELARRFADQVPQTVTEIMKRVDDFVKSEKAYKNTGLPKGEHPKKEQGTPYKGNMP